jgi:hypothetical protein
MEEKRDLTLLAKASGLLNSWDKSQLETTERAGRLIAEWIDNDPKNRSARKASEQPELSNHKRDSIVISVRLARLANEFPAIMQLGSVRRFRDAASTIEELKDKGNREKAIELLTAGNGPFKTTVSQIRNLFGLDIKTKSQPTAEELANERIEACHKAYAKMVQEYGFDLIKASEGRLWSILPESPEANSCGLNPIEPAPVIEAVPVKEKRRVKVR